MKWLTYRTTTWTESLACSANLDDRWPAQIVGINREQVLDAAHIKAHYLISHADAFAVALAQELEALVVAGDPEFRRVEDIVRVLQLERDETVGH